MEILELALAIAIGILWAKLFIDLIEFIVEYPVRKKRNRMLREMMADITKMTDRVIADIESNKAKKPRVKKVTKKGAK